MKFEDLHILLEQLEANASLFSFAQLRSRIEALDKLDAHLGGEVEEPFKPTSPDASTLDRFAAIRRRLEAANTEVYSAIREEIRNGNRDSLRNWIDLCRDAQIDTTPGLSYDHLDELVAGVLQIRQPGDETITTEPEQVFYQPTPVRHALTMIECSGLSRDDVLIDFGSGLGQVCIIASILTGARAIGIELQAAYVECARDCAQDLQLDRVTFLHADALAADLSEGTVYHLYTPFTGSILQAVLNRLHRESETRPVKVCTLGPCTETVKQEPWLRTNMPPFTDRVALFQSE